MTGESRRATGGREVGFTSTPTKKAVLSGINTVQTAVGQRKQRMNNRPTLKWSIIELSNRKQNGLVVCEINCWNTYGEWRGAAYTSIFPPPPFVEWYGRPGPRRRRRSSPTHANEEVSTSPRGKGYRRILFTTAAAKSSLFRCWKWNGAHNSQNVGQVGLNCWISGGVLHSLTNTHDKKIYMYTALLHERRSGCDQPTFPVQILTSTSHVPAKHNKSWMDDGSWLELSTLVCLLINFSLNFINGLLGGACSFSFSPSHPYSTTTTAARLPTVRLSLLLSPVLKKILLLSYYVIQTQTRKGWLPLRTPLCNVCITTSTSWTNDFLSSSWA